MSGLELLVGLVALGLLSLLATFLIILNINKDEVWEEIDKRYF